jgi:uncharacterized damage-inducible protein DinB
MQQPNKNFKLELPETPLPASLAFLRHARFRLREDYPVKISEAVAALSNEQVCWRPNEASNSIGNLLLHLSGNARQWIIAGVGGAADVRERAREFAEREQLDKAELLSLLTHTLAEADAVLARLEAEVAATQSDAPLQRVCRAQGFAQTVFDALFHVVEHFSYHTGQIVYLAKAQEPCCVRFYDEQRLNRP